MTGAHGLAALRQAMTDYLTAQGVESMTAWPKDRAGALTAPLAVVQVKEVEAGSAGFQNYLGQRYDAESRSWTAHRPCSSCGSAPAMRMQIWGV